MVQEAIVVIKVTYLLQPLFLSIELIEVFKETFTLPTASWSLNSSSSLYSPKAAIYHTEAAGGGGGEEGGGEGWLSYVLSQVHTLTQILPKKYLFNVGLLNAGWKCLNEKILQHFSFTKHAAYERMKDKFLILGSWLF